WSHAGLIGVAARAFVVTRLDREHANWDNTVASIRDMFGGCAVPVAVPGGGSGVIDLTRGAGGSSDPSIAAARETLIEALADCDDGLMERYLEGESVSDEEIHEVLARASREGAIFPIVPAGALT